MITTMIKAKYKIGLMLISITLMVNSALAQCINNEKGHYTCSGLDEPIDLISDDENDNNTIDFDSKNEPYPYDYAIDYSGADFTLQSGDDIMLTSGGVQINSGTDSDIHNDINSTSTIRETGRTIKLNDQLEDDGAVMDRLLLEDNATENADTTVDNIGGTERKKLRTLKLSR